MIKIQENDEHGLTFYSDTADPWIIYLGSEVLQLCLTSDESHTVVVTNDMDNEQGNLICISNKLRTIKWMRKARTTASNKNAYVSIEINSNDNLFAWDWDGNREEICIANGNIIYEEFLK